MNKKQRADLILFYSLSLFQALVQPSILLDTKWTYLLGVVLRNYNNISCAKAGNSYIFKSCHWNSNSSCFKINPSG